MSAASGLVPLGSAITREYYGAINKYFCWCPVIIVEGCGKWCTQLTDVVFSRETNKEFKCTFGIRQQNGLHLLLLNKWINGMYCSFNPRDLTSTELQWTSCILDIQLGNSKDGFVNNLSCSVANPYWAYIWILIQGNQTACQEWSNSRWSNKVCGVMLSDSSKNVTSDLG